MTEHNGVPVPIPDVLSDAEMLLAEMCVAAARTDDPALYIACAQLNHCQPTIEMRFLYRVVRVALALAESPFTEEQ
ncbi:hypothetical protein [Mycobacterium seoulense]|uniref:hypothetical protein n=1 Tax=Mycobacterium seoulense TaxID=386911 RepID=UPI003CF80FDC